MKDACTPTVGKGQDVRGSLVERKKGLVAGGRLLSDWDSDFTFVDRVRSLLSLQPIGIKARCILPTSDTQRRSSIWLDDRGYYVYTSEPSTGLPLTLPLAAVHCSLTFRRVYEPRQSDPILALFKCDLLRLTDSVAPPTIFLPTLPPQATELDKHVRTRITELFQSKWIADPGKPSVISRGFLSEWAGISEDQAREARQRLKKWGVIVEAGSTTWGRFNSTLWLPGGGA